MRVLYVVHQFFPKHYTGTERFTFDLCKQMQKMGYRVDVLTYGIADDSGYDYTKNDFLIKEYEFDGVSVTSIRHKHMPEDVSFDIFMAEMEGFLYELLPNYDLIHVFHPMRLGTVIRVAKKLNIPTILTLTDFWVICPGAQLLTPNGKLCYGASEPQKCVKDCYGKSWADKLTRRFREMKELVRMVDCIVAPTYFLASMIKNVLDVHIPVIPYGLDYRFVKDIPKKSRENLTLGFIGSVLPHKGVHTLIKAIKLLDYNNVRVKIYGDYFHAVEYIHQLKNLADNDKRIEFTGKYDYSEISRILSELDMVVVPSIWWENAPFTIQTSFAYKTPVIASNLGGMSEVVKDGVNGFLFEAGNAENLAEVIRKIATNQRVLNSIRATIISPPRIEEVAFEYEKLYLNPITGKSQELIVTTNGRIGDTYKAKYGNDFVFDIDERDGIYHFLVKAPTVKDPIVEYFSSGKSMLTILQEIFEDIGYGFNQIDTFLDFASGHGRFTRFLIQKLSSEKITVSDRDKTAVDFCKKTFGVNGFYSVENPNRLIHNNKYDVIYVASLFSHLSLQLWNGWLKRLYNMLNEGGILIFSTHGMDCYSQVDDEVKNHVFGEGVIEKVEEGFLYKPILSKDYGTAFVSCDYVKKVIRQNNIGNIVAYYPQKLWDLQDIYVIQKEGQYETTDSKETIPFPRHVTISNTYKCNLKCIMCFKRFENSSIPYMQLPSMSDELIDKIIHELFPCIETFALTVAGEPLADKNYKKIIDAAKEFNVKLKLLTNGFFLNDFQTIKDILEVSKSIEVSMDGLWDLYESIRIGSKFDIIDRNLKLLVNIRNKLGLADKVKIGLDVVLMKMNIEQLPDIILYASDIGLDLINTSHLLVLDKSLSNECLVNHKVSYSTIYDRSICVAQAKNVPLAIPPKFDINNENVKPIISNKSHKSVNRKRIYCPFIYEQSWIQVNGDVNPCCNPGMFAIMGNIKKNSFEEVWNNENYSKLRDSFKTGDISECCKSCCLLYEFTDPDKVRFD